MQTSLGLRYAFRPHGPSVRGKERVTKPLRRLRGRLGAKSLPRNSYPVISRLLAIFDLFGLDRSARIFRGKEILILAVYQRLTHCRLKEKVPFKNVIFYEKHPIVPQY